MQIVNINLHIWLIYDIHIYIIANKIIFKIIRARDFVKFSFKYYLSCILRRVLYNSNVYRSQDLSGLSANYRPIVAQTLKSSGRSNEKHRLTRNAKVVRPRDWPDEMRTSKRSLECPHKNVYVALFT